ncbi:MAG: hypothetical protein LWX07_05740 [Bacteroidetes bacterium]|nr:hypothetical protein [Bacteroidota bacterium]
MPKSRIFRTFLFLTILSQILSTFSASAQENKKSGFLISANIGGNYLLELDGKKNTGTDYSLSTVVFEFGYRANNYNEFGICAGKYTDTYPYLKVVSGYVNGDTLYTYYQAPIEYDWIGLYYKFHLRNILSGGVRIGHMSGSETYQEISVGKDFNILEKISARTSVYYGIVTHDMLNFSEKNPQHTFGATLGLIINL